MLGAEAIALYVQSYIPQVGAQWDYDAICIRSIKTYNFR